MLLRPQVADVSEDVKPEKKSAATLLVEIARDLYRFAVTDTGETFGVPLEGPRVVHMLRSGKVSLRKQLARVYFNRFGKAAPQQALADALLVVEGMAQEEEPTPLAVRVARTAEASWLDMGDHTGRAVKVTAGGWAVADRAPMLFRRTELTGALPEPQRGSRLDEVWHWLNVEPLDRPLVAAWLVSLLYPDIPHPVLNLSGEQGTGKTTAQKVLVSTLDPTPVPCRKPPRDAESWITAAAGSWVVGLDNLSEISGWLSDSICRAVTGDGDIRRKLYTDGELAVFAFRRCIVMSGIDLGAVRGDLADRMLPIGLHVIGDEQRLEENQLWPRWSRAHPRILGAVLDLATGVHTVLPSVTLARKPRMADYARLLAAVDKVLGTNGFDRYADAQGTLARESLTGDPFITAIGDILTPTGRFVGTAGDLLQKVMTPGDEKWRAPKDWPANARQVTKLLRRQSPVMRKAGWGIYDDEGHNELKVLKWTITPPPPPPPQPRDARNSHPSDPSDPCGQDQTGVTGITGVEYGPSQDDQCCQGGPLWKIECAQCPKRGKT